VNTTLRAASFDDPVGEALWSTMCTKVESTECDSLCALDYIIKLFLTVKVFAVAHKKRDLQKRKVRDDCRKSKSLRGKLKASSSTKKHCLNSVLCTLS